MSAPMERPYLEKRRQVEHAPERLDVCGCLPPLAVGYLACLFTLAEGLILIFHMAEVIKPDEGLFAGLYGGHNPFEDAQKGILWVVGITDFVAVVVGVVGLYLSIHLAPDVIRRGMTSGHAGNLPILAIGALLIWRVFVTAGIAPWVGIYVAFKNPDQGDTVAYVALALVTIFVNIAFDYGLAQVFRATVLENEFINARTAEANVEERVFLRNASNRIVELDDAEPRIFFNLLPAEFVLRLWCLFLTVVCLVWLFLVLSDETTIGGWGFVDSMPYLSKTRWLECIAYSVGVVGAIIGLMGIIGHKTARNHEAITLSSVPGSAEYYIDLDSAIKTRKRSTVAILLFFFSNVFRIACFVPMTGMAMVLKDVCGIYVHALSTSSLSEPWYNFGGTSLHCSGSDYGLLLFATGMIVLDFYMLWAIFKLWVVYRFSDFTSKAMPVSGEYGSVVEM